ncbi:hypothetical protein [Alkalicoccus daliensis]|uniref:Uncharacterized protein n=1 Tax=Alkalicoccus daliensis TaxID=745820 RepID=A0A1H0D289_9BACI|nr:hypothetical protein [Alkalicoccus daliensis]SDN63931.1 hypothetical protein SAMN04488053_102308 [Alkalicoccus daliensis]
MENNIRLEEFIELILIGHDIEFQFEQEKYSITNIDSESTCLTNITVKSMQFSPKSEACIRKLIVKEKRLEEVADQFIIDMIF